MGDSYREIMVKRETSVMDQVKKISLIGLTVLMFAGGIFITPLLLLVGLALAIVCYFIVPGFDLEYEYLYVNGELDIDKIMAKTKRKKVISLDVAQADLIAPVNSHRMDYYNGNQKMKTMDFSSGNPEHKRYAMITRLNNESCRVIIEPDDRMIQAIKNSAPGKVFLD